ncbi:MAG: pyruvate, phosphate dikinase/phosphoenolpyruvate synthase regulator [Candidatus Omnitrophota bacterium]|nr:pyruvate, phosphate dikinase/phosphoenolpyruvate synthase regulator [Candidatus Omnitrophota bacterium]
MASKAKRRKWPLYLISDSSGNLLVHFFHALLSQFRGNHFQIHTLPFVNNQAKIEQTLRKLKKGIVFHAVANRRLKDVVAEVCSELRLGCWDVTGPTAEFLEKESKIKLSEETLPFHALDANYMGRMEALEFAMQHDDSRRLEQIREAEIVLVGISRVSKSPTALFLAYRGFRTANISIVPATGLPAELGKHRRRNVVALTLRPKKLAQIRARRFSSWDTEKTGYEDIRQVIREVMEAEQLFKKKKWPIIDTTDLAVEETSSLVLEALRLKPKLFLTSAREID